jgi:hypothetical protein
MGSRPVFVNYKKAALDSQPQMLKFTNCLPIVGGSLKVLQLLPESDKRNDLLGPLLIDN